MLAKGRTRPRGDGGAVGAGGRVLLPSVTPAAPSASAAASRSPLTQAHPHTRLHHATNSFEQYEHLVAGEDEDDDDGEEDGEDDDGEVDEEGDDDAAFADADHEADADDANLDYAAALYPSLFTLDGMGSMPIDDADFLFPVHLHGPAEEDADEVLFADSGASTPRHPQSARRAARLSARDERAPLPADLPWGGASVPPVRPASPISRPQFGTGRGQPVSIDSQAPGSGSTTPRRPASPRRYVPGGDGGLGDSWSHLGSSLNRPLSADLERRSVDRLPSGDYRAAAAAAASAGASPAAVFASPAAPRRAPFHHFGNGPVAARASAAAAAAGHPSPPAPPVPLLPPVIARHRGPLAPRPASPISSARNELQQSKNLFSSRGGGAPSRPVVAPPVGTTSPPGPTPSAPPAALPPRSDFPDFPSMRPTPLPSTFSAAPSQPLALLQLPPNHGDPTDTPTTFALPPGYEIVRRLPGGSGSATVAQTPGRGGTPAHDRFVTRALADVLQRMAAAYGLREPTTHATPNPTSARTASKRSARDTKYGEEDENDIAEASISFTDVDATSRPTSAVRERRADTTTTAAMTNTSAGTAATSTTAKPSAAPASTSNASWNAKVAGLSSFLRDALDEFSDEGGTPRSARTPESRRSSISRGRSAGSDGVGEGQLLLEEDAFPPPPATAAGPRPSTALDLLSMSDGTLMTPREGDDKESEGAEQLQQRRQVEANEAAPVTPATSDAHTNALSPVPERARPASPALAPLKVKAWSSRKLAKDDGGDASGGGAAAAVAPAPTKSKRAASKKTSTTLGATSHPPSALTSPIAGARGGVKITASGVNALKDAHVSAPLSNVLPNGRVKRSVNGTTVTATTNTATGTAGHTPPTNFATSDTLASVRDNKDASVGGSTLGQGSSSTSGKSKKLGGRKKKKVSAASRRAKALTALRSAGSGSRLAKLVSSAPIRGLCVVGDQEVWTCEKDGVIVVRDALTGEALLRLAHLSLCGGNGVSALLYACGVVWAGTDTGALLRIDPETRDPLPPPPGATRTFTAGITALAFDGRTRVFAASQDHLVRAWDAATGAYLRTFTGHTLVVRAILCRGFTQVWTAAADHTVRIFSVDTGECLQVLTGHTDAVTCLVAVGPTVVSGSADGTLRVWRLADPGPANDATTQAPISHPLNALLPPPAAVVSEDARWECVQTVSCGNGRIASLLLVTSNQLWSVGQYDRVARWKVVSGTGRLQAEKPLASEAAHASFISGVSLVRRTEIKTIWSHSTAAGASSDAANAAAADNLCVWTHVAHNGKDPAEQLQVARNANLTLRSHLLRLQHGYHALRLARAHDARAFQGELQRVLLVAAEHHGETLRARDSEATHDQARLEAEAARDAMKRELSAAEETSAGLRRDLAQLEDQKSEQAILHEEYATNLKRVISDAVKRREAAEASVAELAQQNEQLEQRLEHESARVSESDARAAAAESRASELDDLVRALRAEALAAREETQLERERVQALEAENARLRDATAASAADAARADQLARELLALVNGVDRLRRRLADGLARPLRHLTPANATALQADLLATANQAQTDANDAARATRAIMHAHLTDVQKLHIGMAGHAGAAAASSPLSPVALASVGSPSSSARSNPRESDMRGLLSPSEVRFDDAQSDDSQ